MENNHISFVPHGVKHEPNYWGTSKSIVFSEFREQDHVVKDTEVFIRLHIKQKPRLLPTKIWEFLLSKLIVLDKFKRYEA